MLQKRGRKRYRLNIYCYEFINHKELRHVHNKRNKCLIFTSNEREKDKVKIDAENLNKLRERRKKNKEILQ